MYDMLPSERATSEGEERQMKERGREMREGERDERQRERE
jgi:hypothetical protein